MAGNYENKPSAIRSGALRESKNGNRYIWSRTMDLNDVIREVGTSIVTISVFQRKKGDDVKPEDRVFIFNPSEPKWLPKGKTQQGNHEPQNGNAGNSDDGEVIL